MSLSHAVDLSLADERISARYRLLLDIRTPDDGASTSVVIHDVSQTGLLFETDERLESDAELELMLPGVGKAAARIIWSSGRFYGAQLDRAISADALKRLYSASKVVWPSFETAPTDFKRRPSGSSTLHDGIAIGGAAGLSAAPSLPVALRIQAIMLLSVALWAGALASISLFL